MESRKRVFMAGLPEVRHRGNIRSDRIIDLLKPPPQPRARPSYQQHGTVSRLAETRPAPADTIPQNASCSSTPNIPNPKRIERSPAPEPPKRATSASPTLASERYLLERVELLDHKLQAITEQLCLFTKILSNQSPAPPPQPTPDSMSYHYQQQPLQHNDYRPISRQEHRQYQEHRQNYASHYEYPRDVINQQHHHHHHHQQQQQHHSHSQQQQQQYHHQTSSVAAPSLQQRQPAFKKPDPIKQQKHRPATPEEPLCDVSMASIDYLKRYNILD